MYRDPGEDEIRANWFTFSATSKMLMVEMMKAMAQPCPASPKTRGTVITGAPVGAMRPTDCANVSLGDSVEYFSPYEFDVGDSGANGAAGTNLSEELPSSIRLY